MLKENQTTILYQNNVMERLVRHYIGVFQEFGEALEKHEMNEESSTRIHERLLETQVG